MKIENRKLTEFLQKVKLQGMEEIRETILDFNNEGLHIEAMSMNGAVFVNATLSKDAFLQYEAIGKIALQDIPMILKVINRFGKELTIEVRENIIVLKDEEKEMTTELMNVDYIKPMEELPNFEFAETFKLPINFIQSTLDDASVNKEYSMIFETIEKSLIAKSTGKFKFLRSFKSEDIKGGTKVEFGTPFINAVTNLNNDVEISLKSQYPIKIVEKTDSSLIIIVSAPLTKPEE